MVLFIFDIDGTLIADNHVATKAFQQSIKDFFNITRYCQQWDKYTEDSDIGIIKQIVKDYLHRSITWQEITAFQDHYLKCFQSFIDTPKYKVTPVEGISDFFHDMKENEVRSAIFTGGFPKVALKKLEMISMDTNLLLSSAFDGLSRECIFDKCLRQAKTIYELETDKVILFGDALSDIKISKKYKLPLVGITTHISKEEFYAEGVTHTLMNFRNINVKELLRYVYC